MNVGDLVIRKDGKDDLGIVLSKRMSGHPAHPCVVVWYMRTGKAYEMAESIMEVISENR